MGAIAIRNVVKRYGRGASSNQVIHGINHSGFLNRRCG